MRTAIPLTALILFSASTVRAQYKAGDSVVVIHDNVPITVKEKVLQEVYRGLCLKVQSVNGQWLWVSNEATGWISTQHVTTVPNAIDVFTEQIRQNSKDSGAYVARGCAWQSKGEIDIAIGDFNDAIRLNPKDSFAYVDRGICWSSKREVDKAIADYSEAIRLNPKNPIPFCNRAADWCDKSEFDKAIADATEAIRIAPRYSSAYCNRAGAWVRKNDHDKAISDFSEAIKIDPTDAVCYRGRAWCWSAKKEPLKAISDYSEAVKFEPKDEYSFRNRALAWASLKNFQNALADCDEAHRIYPKTSAYNAVAWSLATCSDAKYRDGKMAIEFATKSCESSGWKDANRIDTLAAAYAEAGDFEMAVEWQTKALAGASENQKPELQAHLDLYKSGKPYREEKK